MTSKIKFSTAILEDIAYSGLTADDLIQAGCYEENGNLVFRYPNGLERTRLTTPKVFMRNGKEVKQRYSQPRGTAPALYLPSLAGIPWKSIKEKTDLRIYVTEGEKKSLAICKLGLPCIGLAGVDCWASKGGIPLPQWDEFNLKDREVVIVFDADIVDKPQVRSAERRVANMLSSRGAKVSRLNLASIELPAKLKGVDEFLKYFGLGTKSAIKVRHWFESLTLENIPIIPRVDTIIPEMNAEFAVVNFNGQLLIQRETSNAEGYKDVIYLRPTDFRLLLQNRSATDQDSKLATYATAWLQHASRRWYSRVVFNPNGCEPDEYNLWQGYHFESKAGDWGLIRQHLSEVICGGDPIAFSYLMAWCADLLQNPANLVGVAVVMRGEEGIGKSIFMDWLLKLVAPHSVKVTQGNQIIGRFNSILKGMLLVGFEEAFWAGDKSFEGVLKGLITEKDLVIEHKGKEPIRINNFARIIMASNSDWVIPAAHGARRFFVLNVSDQYKGNFEYFNKLITHAENGGIQAFAHYLKHLDIRKINLRQVPKTKALLDQKMESMDSVDRFLYDMLMDGVNNGDNWEKSVAVEQLHKNYLDSAHAMGERWTIEKNKFGRRLVKQLELKRERVMVNLIREYVWMFPSLDQCRERFAQYFEADFDWQDIKDPHLPPECRLKTSRY